MSGVNRAVGAGVAGASVGSSRSGGHVVVEDLTLATGVVLPDRGILQCFRDGPQDDQEPGELLLGGLKQTQITQINNSPSLCGNATVPCKLEQLSTRMECYRDACLIQGKSSGNWMYFLQPHQNPKSHICIMVKNYTMLVSATVT